MFNQRISKVQWNADVFDGVIYNLWPLSGYGG